MRSGRICALRACATRWQVSELSRGLDLAQCMHMATLASGRGLASAAGGQGARPEYRPRTEFNSLMDDVLSIRESIERKGYDGKWRKR